ncbi:MAG: hypothetical protein ACE14V_04320 [bacterium]
MDIAGLQPHLERILLVMKQGIDRIFLMGLGRENVINIKRLNNQLSKHKYLNKIAENQYIINDQSGSQYILQMTIYENYYYKTLEYEKAQNDEIIELLNTHVPEIADGSIEILEVARVKNIISKILLKTDIKHINSVACCVGKNHERINNMESKLVGETLFFIEYSDDIKTMIRNALSPFKTDWIKDVRITSQLKTAYVFVDDDKIALAIGKLGLNVKLAEQLIGWKIYIKKSSLMNA